MVWPFSRKGPAPDKFCKECGSLRHTFVSNKYCSKTGTLLKTTEYYWSTCKHCAHYDYGSSTGYVIYPEP